jgi:hypothetical protein
VLRELLSLKSMSMESSLMLATGIWMGSESCCSPAEMLASPQNCAVWAPTYSFRSWLPRRTVTRSHCAVPSPLARAAYCTVHTPVAETVWAGTNWISIEIGSVLKSHPARARRTTSAVEARRTIDRTESSRGAGSRPIRRISHPGARSASALVA